MMDGMDVGLPVDGRFSWMPGDEPNIRFIYKCWIVLTVVWYRHLLHH